LVEQGIPNPQVVGSSPTTPAIKNKMYKERYNGIKTEIIDFIIKESKKQGKSVDGETIKMIIKYFEEKEKLTNSLS
jgi:hypothetical protein